MERIGEINIKKYNYGKRMDKRRRRNYYKRG